MKQITYKVEENAANFFLEDLIPEEEAEEDK